MCMEPSLDSDAALRVEHDRLSRKLSTRHSIDAVRRGVYAIFGLFICCGLSAKLAYDRWGPNPPRVFKGPPLFFYLAMAAAAVCLVIAGLSFLQARRKMRLENRDFSRLRELRDRLELTP